MEINDRVTEINSNVAFGTIIGIELYDENDNVYLLQYDVGNFGYWPANSIKKAE